MNLRLNNPLNVTSVTWNSPLIYLTNRELTGQANCSNFAQSMLRAVKHYTDFLSRILPSKYVWKRNKACMALTLILYAIKSVRVRR